MNIQSVLNKNNMVISAEGKDLFGYMYYVVPGKREFYEPLLLVADTAKYMLSRIKNVAMGGKILKIQMLEKPYTFISSQFDDILLEDMHGSDTIPDNMLVKDGGLLYTGEYLPTDLLHDHRDTPETTWLNVYNMGGFMWYEFVNKYGETRNSIEFGIYSLRS